MAGFITLSRKLQKNNLWLSEVFTRGQAWVDLLMLANYADGFIIVRGVQVDIKRGQCGWSENRLAERWRWSRGKVRRFLKLLEGERQVVQQKSKITSIISITKYEEYQSADNRRTTDGTTDGTLRTKDNKKNNKTYTFKPPKVEEVKAYCEERKNSVNPEIFVDFYTASNWMRGKNKIKDWKACVRTWEKRNNETSSGSSTSSRSRNPSAIEQVRQRNDELEQQERQEQDDYLNSGQGNIFDQS